MRCGQDRAESAADGLRRHDKVLIERDVDGIDVTKTGDWNSRLIKLAAVVHCYKALHGVLLAPHH
jgi:hypothetical protein